MTLGARAASSVLRAAGGWGPSAAVATRLAESVDKAVVDDIFKCAIKKQTGVSLKYMLDFGANPIERQLLLSAQFLHNELPIRLAHRVTELENLPYGLSAKPHVLKVRDWYVSSFSDLRRFPTVKDANDERAFTELLRSIYERHRNVVPVMAMGVAELKQELFGKDEAAEESGGGGRGRKSKSAAAAAERARRRLSSLDELPEIHSFLDGFYLSRIGIRMLIGQHISLHEPAPADHYIGMIDTRCSPVSVARAAIDDARAMCSREYGGAPDVVVYGDPSFTFAYVPSHLHHMLFELVKNSLRAVNDRFEESDDAEAPPVRLVVAEGDEDVTLKVSDEGGGIPRSGLPRIWTYLYSTARSPLDDMEKEGEGDDGPAVLAGYGYGLPISRLYARYFGGDLQIISMEGYGTDAYLHLNRLGNVSEPLP